MTSSTTAGASAHPLPRGFGWFFAGRAVDMAGGSMTPVALALAVLAHTDSTADLGIVMAANMTTTLALMLIGGVLGDRISRRTILIVTSLIAAAAQAGMAMMLLTDHYNLLVMATLSVVMGAVGALNGPALRGIVPELVEPEQLQRANAALASVRNVTRIGGPALAGILVATAGGGWALAVDALSFLLAALCFTRLPQAGHPKPSQGIWRDLTEGWSAFINTRWVVAMSISVAIMNALMVGPWMILGPAIISHRDGPIGWGAVLSIRAVGLLMASLALLRLTFRRPLLQGRLIGTLSALPLLLLGLTQNTWLVAAGALIAGIGITASNITYESTLQSRVPKHVLSRVSAYDDLIAWLAIPISQLAVAPAQAALGAAPLATACGIGYIAASLLPLLAPSVRHVDDEHS